MCHNSKTDASVTKLVIEYQNFISVFKIVQYCTSRLFRDSKQHSGHGTFHWFFLNSIRVRVVTVQWSKVRVSEIVRKYIEIEIIVKHHQSIYVNLGMCEIDW